MSYAQSNYLQIQGRVSPSGVPPKYPISAIGCFLTSKANMLTERFGISVDPLGLNAFFRDRDVFIDVDDGIFDDLGWGSVSAYAPQVVVSEIGTGWPSSNNSIVKFVYISPRLHHQTTHFALVVDAAKHLILDPWDSVVKNPGLYGEPVAYASYVDNVPQAPTPVTAPAPQANIGKQIFLPSAAGTWRVYPLGGQILVGKEKGKLAPGNFAPGLTYDIEGNPAPNIYTITTQTYGQVNIYGGPDTIAEFRDKPAPPVEAPPVIVPVPEPTPPPVVTPEPAAPVEDNHVVVKVIHTDPDAWKKITTESKMFYVNESYNVVDYSGQNPPRPIIKETLIHIAGWFTKDGIVYGIRQTSIDKGWFYGFPKDTLESPDADDLIREIYHNPMDATLKEELDQLRHNKRKIWIAILATIDGVLTRFKFKKPKNKGAN